MAAGIRSARASDAEQVAAVHVASWQWAYAGLLPAEELADLSVADRADRWRTRPVGPGREDVGGASVGEL